MTAPAEVAGTVLVVIGCIGGLLVGVWQIDAHFVTRREFKVAYNEILRQLRELRRLTGGEPGPPITDNDDE